MDLHRSNLGTYLNDHLAGSVAAVDLLERIHASFPEADVGRLAERLRREINEEQEYLKSLINNVASGESLTRKVGGWVGGKLAAVKLKLDDPSTSDFFLFESLEALSLGIEGKRSLWIALQLLVSQDPHLNADELRGLQEQAERQRSDVEAKRREFFIPAMTARPTG
jgi:hypothetical protein